MKVVLLSGGGGGARFARGLADMLAPGDLTVVGNVGDDLEILGLHVSPDLDSLLYTLAGLIDEKRGWGREGESWNALASARAWGGEDWFRLGDLDIGLHLVRTEMLRAGVPLSDVTAQLVRRRARERADPPGHRRPASHPRPHARGHVSVPGVVRRSGARGRGRRRQLRGRRGGPAAPGVLEALAGAEAILIAPSNPYLSIGPTLAVPEIRAALESRRVRCVAVSPLIGGKAVSGPLDRMLSRMAGGTTPAHVTDCYSGLIDALVVDESDAAGRGTQCRAGGRPGR